MPLNAQRSIASAMRGSFRGSARRVACLVTPSPVRGEKYLEMGGQLSDIKSSVTPPAQRVVIVASHHSTCWGHGPWHGRAATLPDCRFSISLTFHAKTLLHTTWHQIRLQFPRF